MPHGTSTPGSGTSTDTSTAGIHSTVAANAPATTMTRSAVERRRPEGNASMIQTSTNSATCPSARAVLKTHGLSDAASPRTA